MFGRCLEYVLVLLGLKKSEKIGCYLTTRLARRMVPSYKFTWPELRWFVDKDLNGLLHKFGEDDGFNAHRRFALQQLLRLTALVPGDTAGCGARARRFSRPAGREERPPRKESRGG